MSNRYNCSCCDAEFDSEVRVALHEFQHTKEYHGINIELSEDELRAQLE